MAKKQFQLKIPSKVIISGEFSVIFKYPVITTPVDLFLTLKVTTQPRIVQNTQNITVVNEYFGTFSYDSQIPQISNLFVQIFDMCCSFFDIKSLIETLTLHFEYSEAVAGEMGLGSSATFILSVFLAAEYIKTGAILQHTNATSFDFLRSCEDLFHGRSSGLDILTILNGRFGQYTREETNLKFEPFESNNYVILAVDSGVKKQTKQSVTSLLSRRVADPKIDDLLAEIGTVTEHLGTQFKAPKNDGKQAKIDALLAQNQKILDEIGVSSARLNWLCQTLSSSGLSFKMSGGGVGGLVITVTAPCDPRIATLRSLCATLNLPLLTFPIHSSLRPSVALL